MAVGSFTATNERYSRKDVMLENVPYKARRSPCTRLTQPTRGIHPPSITSGHKLRKGVKMETLTYTRHGDYLLPNIVLQEPPPDAPPLGRYGRKRRAFLKEHRPILYTSLLLSEKLFPHLREIDEAAAHRLAVITDREQAEEIINAELIYD